MKQTTPDTPRTQPDETIKETFESIIIAFILAFVFRAYIVEAFVIPTGSMAPTLLGAHYRAECEQCGYDFKINYNPDAPQNWQSGATCPMCDYNINMARNAKSRPGDRILVHKYIYTISEPRRWDVVVFKAPHQPNINFIKRLVGLPNESLRLLDGNVYTQAEGESAWKIARKGDTPKVQRAVWQPIYHSQFIPRDHGELKGPGERSPRNYWKVPWIAEAGQWDIKDRRSYHFQGGDTGRIAFDFREGGNFDLPSIYAYNQFDTRGFSDHVEDIRVAASLELHGGDTSIQISTQTRLAGSTQTVTARVDTDGTISLFTIDPDTSTHVELMRVKGKPLDSSGATPIELWAVDQELSVWVHGKRALRYLYASELSGEELANRPPPARIPHVQIELSGGAATLHQVELDRDIYYASSNAARPARGGMMRDAQGRVMSGRIRPMTLYDNEFFCIGDNNPLSDDGRFWSPGSTKNNSEFVSPDALWVRHRYFDKEVTDNLRDGIVPGDLMMGRAFFVYFPAPYTWKPNGPGLIPNFADMRFIH